MSDDEGNVLRLSEKSPGLYKTDSLSFRGRVGATYTLHISYKGREYQSSPAPMLPVPAVDSLYYEKTILGNSEAANEQSEGCNIYLDSYDASGRCRFFRWNYSETWEYHIPYPVVNRVCWVSGKSDMVLIKSTSELSKARVSKFRLISIPNTTDKLQVKYSIMVNQFSISEEEFNFWEKVRNIAQNVGGLYDRNPQVIEGNISCISDPSERVLGWFSVSAVASRRLFISERFLGQPHFYSYCATDTLYGSLPAEGLNKTYWVIEDWANEVPPWWVITEYRECADCTTEGSKVKPDFWDDDRISMK